jgi:hypothetical protein
MPSTRAILKILEPMALPMLNPVFPSIAAKPDTNISGAEVPKPKISKPITKGDTLKIVAIFAPLLVNVSALQIKSIKPVKRVVIASRISVIINKEKLFAYYKGIFNKMNKTEFLIGRSGLGLQDDFYPDDLP